MKFIQAILMAISSIFSNKVRSFLTMLGVIIGVASVIALVSIGQGATVQVTEQIESMGSNLISVRIIGRNTNRTVDMEEFMELKERYPNIIGAIAPVVQSNVTAEVGNNNMETTIEGSLPEYQDIVNLELQSGRFIMDIDNDFRNKVAVLGQDVVDELFGTISPLGQEISINGYRFKVVGILEEKGTTMGGSSDDRIIIPLSTAQRLTRTSSIQSYNVQAASKDSVNSAVSLIEDFLTRELLSEDLFSVFSQTELLESVNSATQVLTLMLGGIAGISLLVGGIGIMNIMLVAVSERTKEIGLRKAIGAKRSDILFQFMIESIVVSGLGGIIGIIVGTQGAQLISKFMNMPVSTSLSVVIISFGFAVLTGVIFGIYPANKAARLKPIDALRAE